ncbi:MAG: type II toxin-antitoxin system PemK/MazF family toxin [Rickettsiales bacterium]
MLYKQLDILWVDLNPMRGSETRKKRPFVDIQSDLVNKSSHTIIVAPILPNHKEWPFVVNITANKINNLDRDRHINLKQLRAVDVSHIGKRQGIIEKKYVNQIYESLKIIFGINILKH